MNEQPAITSKGIEYHIHPPTPTAFFTTLIQKAVRTNTTAHSNNHARTKIPEPGIPSSGSRKLKSAPAANQKRRITPGATA